MDFGEEGIDVGEVRKNQQEVIKVKLRRYKDHDFLDIRTWVTTLDPPVPTKKGIAVNPQRIPEFIPILQEAYSIYAAEKEETDETSS